MKRKTLAPFRLAVMAVACAVEQAEVAARAGHTPCNVGLRDALLAAEDARAAMTVDSRTLGDAHELIVLDAEMNYAYRRAIALTPRMAAASGARQRP
jgi:hypothetical protein